MHALDMALILFHVLFISCVAVTVSVAFRARKGPMIIIFQWI